MTKKCTGCGKVARLHDFSKARKGALGRASRCRECCQWDHFFKLYRLTRFDYEALLASQGGACAICQGLPGDKKLCVDHDHSCCPGPRTCGGCVRGLLCVRCNVGLGKLEDYDWSHRATSYLKVRKFSMALPTLSGRGFLLSDGVELKYSTSGVAYARLPLSFRNSRKDADGNWSHDKEIKIEATVFGALAEALTDAVDGRTELAIHGEPYLEDWTDKDGNTRTSVRLNVTSVWPVSTPAPRAAVSAGSARADSDAAPF